MKAYLLLPTLLLGLVSWHLPKLNGPQPLPVHEAGKIIKALQIPGGNYELRTVVIDPGHGGHDPGCSGSHSKEKHLCLAIGKYFATALKENYPGLNVIMTRSTDKFIPLHERAAIATHNKADLFISIHCNYIPNASGTKGTETYVLGLHATSENLAVAKRENEAILYEDNYQENYGYDPNSPEAHIMFSMFQNAFLTQSISFAEKVQKYSFSEASRKNRGVKQAGFLVLRHATMPSVLVEAGFLSNATEENYLKSSAGQKEMANALLMAFSEYKNEMEGRSGAPDGLAKLSKESGDEPIDTEAFEAEVPVAATKSVAIYENKPKQTEKAMTSKGPASDEPKLIKVKQETPLPPPPTKVSPPPPVKEKPTGSGKILPSSPIASGPVSEKKETTQNADIQYRVQLAASPQLLDVTAGKWSKVEYLLEVVEEDRLYKYQVRTFATLDEADRAKQKLRSIGFSDAFVVGYKNGKRVSIF